MEIRLFQAGFFQHAVRICRDLAVFCRRRDEFNVATAPRIDRLVLLGSEVECNVLFGYFRLVLTRRLAVKVTDDEVGETLRTSTIRPRILENFLNNNQEFCHF